MIIVFYDTDHSWTKNNRPVQLLTYQLIVVCFDCPTISRRNFDVGLVIFIKSFVNKINLKKYVVLIFNDLGIP